MSTVKSVVFPGYSDFCHQLHVNTPHRLSTADIFIFNFKTEMATAPGQTHEMSFMEMIERLVTHDHQYVQSRVHHRYTPDIL
jgi:hypothetical protein